MSSRCYRPGSLMIASFSRVLKARIRPVLQDQLCLEPKIRRLKMTRLTEHIDMSVLLEPLRLN